MSFSHGAFYSYADLTGPGALGLMGRALDADSDLRPSRLDTKVPPRRRVESSEEVMAEAEAVGFAKDLYLLLSVASFDDGGVAVGDDVLI